MKAIKNKPVTLILAIFFSLSLHLAALAGIKGFTFPDPTSPNIFIASIEREEPLITTRGRPIKDILRQGLKHKEAGSVNAESNTTVEEKQVPKQSEQDLEDPSENMPPLKEDEGEVAAEDRKNSPQQGEKMLLHDGAERGEKEQSTPDSEQARRTDGTKPFRESLNYDIYWLGIYVGKATIGAVGHNGTVSITSQVNSAPLISNFYRVEDYAESKIIDGMPVSFRIRQHEGKYRSNKETIFDMNNKKVTYIDYLKDIKNEHTLMVAALWDVISGFYHLRTESLEVGQKIFLDVFDSNKFLAVEVDVLGKEKIELFDKREINAIIVRPILKSEGLFQKTGDILVWLSDDDIRIPLKVETEVPIGKVVAKLKGVESEKFGGSDK